MRSYLPRPSVISHCNRPPIIGVIPHAQMTLSTNPEARTVRQLKLLVMVLVFSNIALGGLSFYLLRDMDQRYSRLIGRSVPALNDLRELLADVTTAYRSSGRLLLAKDGTPRPEAAQRMRLALAQEKQFRAEVLQAPLWTEQAAARSGLEKNGAEFERIAADVSRLIAANRDEDAVRAREVMLRPVCDRYLEAIGRAADEIEMISLRANKDYTSKTNQLSTIVLGLGGWPILVTGLLLCFTAVFLLIIMIALRGRETAEMP
jgi:hypothetical protein